MKTAKRTGKSRRNKELNVKSSSARLHTKEGWREKQKETEEMEAAFKNIFLHHIPSDDPVQTTTKTQTKEQILSLTEDRKALYIKQNISKRMVRVPF